ncbi:hypothetical protein NDU88_005302 [Pleurodeles waltl]|uniref:Uncharacterized protein n=1 Tax=Pleurodeles waltl TaxID=8319 RepID=A0AAV7M8X6_PLEWA|nr:hypothetical protein NDU88_005302 [Pleurodeles waltl]
MDMHSERLDQLERCISEVKDSQSTMSSGQAKMSKERVALQVKVDDLEARSHRNNLRVVDAAESTAMDNMEGKQLLRDLRLEYRMLYPARLRVMVDGNPLLFRDHKNLAQFLKRRMAEGRGRKTVETLSRDDCD